eukprot:scaffold9993_cov101-Isochrysis_galbana.AAC.9
MRPSAPAWDPARGVPGAGSPSVGLSSVSSSTESMSISSAAAPAAPVTGALDWCHGGSGSMHLPLSIATISSSRSARHATACVARKAAV